jgi:hypothetical protein
VSPLNQYFDSIEVVNLPQRLDRRREMEDQLSRIRLHADFFPAVAPAEQGDWPSLGARGCYLSHYTILKKALESGCERLLILEDDLDFSPHMATDQQAILEQVRSLPWDFLYLGHVAELPQDGAQAQSFVPWTAGLQTTHFYAVNRRVMERVVPFLEQVMARPEGDPLGGPQHVDGALSMFRAQNPDLRTWIASPVLGFQRSSRSDITARWYDSVPGLGALAGVARRLRSSVRP